MLFILLLLSTLSVVSSQCDFDTQCWEDDLRITKLEALVEHLQSQVSDLTASKIRTEAALRVTQDMLKSGLAQCNKTWTLKRTEIVFPNLEKLALHQQSPTYTETMPVPLPNNTRAVIVQVRKNTSCAISTVIFPPLFLSIKLY